MLLQEEKMKKRKIDRCGKCFFERKCSLKHKIFFWPPKRRKLLSVKVSFCTSLKAVMKKMSEGSLAVETALVLPLFFMGMITIISFMDIYKLQTEHLTELCTKAKQAGMYAYVLEGRGTEEITIPDVYSYEPVGGLLPLGKVWTYNQIRVHAWTGVEYEGFHDSTEPEKMVYVTESGSVYHKSLGCSYINLSVNQVPGSAVATASNQYGEHYSACEICSRNQKPAGCVYITKQGNRYHNLESCSGLKRSVRLVKESDAAGLSCCSRCG